jgi:hypothetical protein
MMPDCAETLCALSVRQPLARIGYPVVTRFGLTHVESRLYSESEILGYACSIAQQIEKFQSRPSVGLTESWDA